MGWLMPHASKEHVSHDKAVAVHRSRCAASAAVPSARTALSRAASELEMDRRAHAEASKSSSSSAKAERRIPVGPFEPYH